MSEQHKPLGITDVVLRDAHQSLLATRLRIDDMLPIAERLDQVGYWSLESWGGATFDACIRYLGEDPWERIRLLKQAMPNTPQQMLFRGQNILGYRHYADDLVEKFVERAATNGVDVFRVFDAMNDARNLETAITAVRKQDRHAQGAMAYTTSPVHDLESWLQLARRIESMGADSLCIKDMAGLLKPYAAWELVSRLKQTVGIPIHMQSHATTGLSTATCLKAAEAGIDNVDAAISSMSMTYGHSPTEALVVMLEGTERSTGLDLKLLEEIAAYFRQVRRKYARFEGSLRGIDARILAAQVPGGMLTNLENQLREQNALERLDEVLEEISRVREDLGHIPLVTPASQIVGTQAVLNVVAGERYQTITRETANVLKGEYGATPAPVDRKLQKRVLAGADPITCRPAGLLEPEFSRQRAELARIAGDEGIALRHDIDDTLTYALIPQVGLKFLRNRDNPDAFEPAPDAAPAPADEPAQAGRDKPAEAVEVYTVELEGRSYVVRIRDGEQPGRAEPPATTGAGVAGAAREQGREPGAVAVVQAPFAGNIFKLRVTIGDKVADGDVLLVLEAMKMEIEIRAPTTGRVADLRVRTGDAVQVGDILLVLE